MLAAPLLQVLAKLPSLRSLSLRGCPLAEQPDYRQAVLALAPHLEILDNQRVVERAAKLQKRKAEAGPAAGSGGDDPDDPDAGGRCEGRAGRGCCCCQLGVTLGLKFTLVHPGAVV